jgi:tryptophan 2,3-dioxygenase
MSDAAVTYTSYLRVDDLLDLQVPRSDGPEHDELLFIVVHQVYELWFKQILWELDHVVELLGTDDEHRAGHTLRRVLAILKVMVAQMDVLETMTPLEFMSFRSRLDSASGFQSVQFRELESVLGLKDAAALDRAGATGPARQRLERRLNAPSLWDAFCAHLARRGFEVSAAVLQRDVTQPVAADANVQEALDEAKELAQMVYPQLLEGRGLASALRSAAERAGVTLLVDVQAGIGYPPQVTTVVYWSCVDALSSASRGSQATISLLDEDGVLSFEVAVDRPYPEERVDRLRDRIEALDGRVIVEDLQASGSRVHGWLPLSR